MNKPISILDSNFKYIPAAKTDISKTFAKIKRELKISVPSKESKEPIVAPVLNPEGFVLSAEWFEME